MTKSTYDVDIICKRLKLGAGVKDALKAKTEGSRFLRETLEREVEERDVRRANTFIKNARFPEHKTFADYDFENVQFPDGVAKTYFTECGFALDRRGLFLYGSPGTGKTHFAIATGMNACGMNCKTRFWRAYELSEALKLAAYRNETRTFFSRQKAFGLFIIDEFGFYPTEEAAMRLLFEFFCAVVYGKAGFILTTNLDFQEWIQRASEPKMAEAIIDRVVHLSHLVQFEGESMRLKTSAMLNP